MSQPKIILISLPLPPDKLRPNARPVYQERARLTKRYRLAARVAAIDAMNRAGWHEAPGWKRATVLAQFVFRTNRRRDRDNLIGWLKAAFDGLADSGLIDNDSGLTHLPPEQYQAGVDERPRVVLTITKGE